MSLFDRIRFEKTLLSLHSIRFWQIRNIKLDSEEEFKLENDYKVRFAEDKTKKMKTYLAKLI